MFTQTYLKNQYHEICEIGHNYVYLQSSATCWQVWHLMLSNFVIPQNKTCFSKIIISQNNWTYFSTVRLAIPASVTLLLALTWRSCNVSDRGCNFFKHESFKYWQLCNFNDLTSFRSSTMKKKQWKEKI